MVSNDREFHCLCCVKNHMLDCFECAISNFHLISGLQLGLKCILGLCVVSVHVQRLADLVLTVKTLVLSEEEVQAMPGLLIF